jgi:hypothetical protein
MPGLEEEGNVFMVYCPEVQNEYRKTFTSINLLYYIYALIYSPDYLKNAKECLKLGTLSRELSQFLELCRSRLPTARAILVGIA